MSADRRGVFVTLDGLGGAGKSTVTGRLRNLLTHRGYRVHATTEPSRAPLGEIARHNTDTYRGRALACLVAADRYHHLDTEIRPQLAAGAIVVCDRYVPSSYVLQRMDGVPFEFIAALNADAVLPDLAVILTADPEVATTRITRRGAHSRFENGLATCRAEAELYADTTARLIEKGYPLLVIDTTRTSIARVAGAIAERIATITALRAASEGTA